MVPYRPVLCQLARRPLSSFKRYGPPMSPAVWVSIRTAVQPCVSALWRTLAPAIVGLLAPVAQRIEHWPPKPGAWVRIPPGVLSSRHGRPHAGCSRLWGTMRVQPSTDHPTCEAGPQGQIAPDRHRIRETADAVRPSTRAQRESRRSARQVAVLRAPGRTAHPRDAAPSSQQPL